jgi:peptidoglycan/LPS O-acetylase OafA/YrhL
LFVGRRRVETKLEINSEDSTKAYGNGVQGLEHIGILRGLIPRRPALPHAYTRFVGSALAHVAATIFSEHAFPYEVYLQQSHLLLDSRSASGMSGERLASCIENNPPSFGGNMSYSMYFVHNFKVGPNAGT